MSMHARARLPSRLGLALIAGLLLGGATQCSYRGHNFGGTSSSSSQTTSGPIARFGSEWVNGVEFQTGSAALTLDGVTAIEAQLLVGQVATVSGTVSGATGTASAVTVTNKLIGPVTAIDLAGGTVTVLGQTVRLTGDTSVGPGVAPTDVGGILLGQVVAVDGYRTSGGLIATRFDRVTQVTLYQASGRVTNLSGALQTLTLAGTTVDWSGIGGLPAGVANGSYVVASGGTLGGLSTLHASSVRLITELPAGASGAPGSIHGAITRYASTSDFDVAGQAISGATSASYLNGASSDLAQDVEVEVSGSYDSGGTLVASTIDVRPVPQVRVVGPVDAIDATAQTLRIAGITLSTNAHTRWDDRGLLALRTFGLATLATGDWVEARGVSSGTAAATVNVLERRISPAPALVELQDVAAAVADPAFTLTGVTVDTHSATFADVTGQSLTRVAFFATVAGKRVRARGTLSGATLSAQTVALRE